TKHCTPSCPPAWASRSSQSRSAPPGESSARTAVDRSARCWKDNPMLLALPEVQALRTLTADGRVLFSTRIVRLFAYGFLSVVLVLYLAELGLSEPQIGLLL